MYRPPVCTAHWCACAAQVVAGYQKEGMLPMALDELPAKQVTKIEKLALDYAKIVSKA